MSTILVASEFPDDWRETMPIWAHMAWATLRKSLPSLRRYELVSFVPAGYSVCSAENTFVPVAPSTDRMINPNRRLSTNNSGYVIIRLKNLHVPAEFRTTYRYLSRSWI